MRRSKPPSILAVSPTGEAGGAEVHLVGVLAGLRDRGSVVSLVILGSGPLEDLAISRGLKVIRGPSFSLRGAASIVGPVLAVRHALRATHPDIVFASHPKGQLAARMAALGIANLAHVTQLYDPPSSRVTSTRLAAKLGGLRLTITEETASAYRAWNPNLHTIVIPPGVDGDKLREVATAGDGNRAWERARLRGEEPRIVMVGRLQRFKGAFDVVEAAALVRRRRPDARFLVIGPDSPIEPGLRRELEGAIKDARLQDSVGLAGRLSAADLAATVRGATLLVHPAHREPFGLAVVEALALGTPVIAYATTGPSSILRDGGGVIVPVGNADALAIAILNVLDDEDILTNLQALAPTVAQRFELSESIERYREVLDRAGEEARQPTGPWRDVASSAFEWLRKRVPLTVAAADRLRLVEHRPLTTVGSVPPGPSGVRDHGHLLSEELRRGGRVTDECWVDSPGTILGSARMTARVLALALALPSRGQVLWHYCPVPHGWRGIPGPGVVLGLVLRVRGCRVVSIVHELAYTYRPGLDPPRARIMAFAQRLALKVVLAGSSEVVVTTDARREALHRRFKRRRVHVVPVFPTIPVAASAVDDDSGSFVIGVPGYAGDGVRPDILVEALALLGDGRSLRTVLLGAPGADSVDGRRWQQLADEHRVAGMEFTGVVGAPELSRHFASCNAVVLVNEEGPSARKTTLATSLAHGLPVVSLDGYNRWDELVAAGAVRVVPPDPQILAATLAELRDSPATRSALAERGRAFAEDHMSLAAAASTFSDLLKGRPPVQDGREPVKLKRRS